MEETHRGGRGKGPELPRPSPHPTLLSQSPRLPSLDAL